MTLRMMERTTHARPNGPNKRAHNVGTWPPTVTGATHEPLVMVKEHCNDLDDTQNSDLLSFNSMCVS